MSIWQACEGMQYCINLTLEPWRVVEAQHISSSRDLVDNRAEHELLEALLDGTKPPSAHFKHYLIFTPFRYPPLKYGSRFGSTYEPSLWYGSISLPTALAEVAYYRLKFFADTTANLEYIEIPMTAFKSFIQTDKGIDLNKHPFNVYRDKIASKTSYVDSQQLGTDMREAGIEAFIFPSARDKDSGKNVAAFTIDVFKAQNKEYITSMQNWRCMGNKNVIEFSRDDLLSTQHLEFTLDLFSL